MFKINNGTNIREKIHTSTPKCYKIHTLGTCVFDPFDFAEASCKIPKVISLDLELRLTPLGRFMGTCPLVACGKEAAHPAQSLTIQEPRIVAVAGLGIIVFLLFYIIRKLAQNDQSTLFWKNKTEKCLNVEAFLKNYGSLAPKRYTYSDIKKMTNSFRVKLGQGGYGCVFKGKLENGCLMAVKVLNGLKDNKEEFINEVAAISRTSYVNIVNLLGFCFDRHNRALLFEFMPNGSHEKFIHDENSLTYHQFGWEALYKITGDKDLSPKISDFGLAKLCHGNKVSYLYWVLEGLPVILPQKYFVETLGEFHTS
ncbi:hypothetical protein ACSBR2_035910 [Camellia fascicularis]